MARAVGGFAGWRTAVAARFGAWLNRPLASFHLILSISALLSILGLVMVLSASSVSEIGRSGSAYSMFFRQLMFITAGWIMFYLALRTPIRVFRRFALVAFLASCVLLVLVLIPGIGVLVNGSRSWFHFAGFAFQPSELVKITLAMWGAVLLGDRAVRTRSIRDMLIPLLPGALVVFYLVAMQPDYSTLVVLFFILLGLLWFAGLPLGFFVVGVGAAMSVAAVMAVAEGYRSQRLRAFFNSDDDPLGASYQARQAKFSLADGGFWGVGLGQSRAKWAYLPEAHNDFIFAIIGEELGFLGCVAVLGLFALFAYTGLRIATRSVDPFLRIFVATSTVWVIGQSFINLGYVVGLLPVTGLQLPLVSSGGTSAVMTLYMLGVIANAARHEPEAIAALRSAPKKSRLSRFLRLPDPEKYVPAKPSRSAPPRGASYAAHSYGDVRAAESWDYGRAGGQRPYPGGRAPTAAYGSPAPVPPEREYRTRGRRSTGNSGIDEGRGARRSQQNRSSDGNRSRYPGHGGRFRR
ncbi:putative lipid II flippase FtsW [Hoyosella altamirensis]|uniref:Probable peptidoglycan glycosyltransferase FtsW n=1 Tax=Hoyosella altamirensis TaxID=616997 RepID=A0A839RSN4_9ACTN|nr:putative lipid II flippase FtsW [Hoyosella altamirensis]MBB3038871.1 cell division protein FtsW [Hoyosella altamirensis]